MDASVGVVEIFDSFPLLGYLLLVVVSLLSYAREKFVYIFQRVSTCLDVLNSFTRINPISIDLAGINLSAIFLSDIILVTNQNNWHHILLILAHLNICTSYAV